MAGDDQVTAEAVLALDPSDIDVGERIGLYWPEKAAAFGALIREHGQHDPIKVRRNGARASRPWRLVAGLHRLGGIQLERLPIVYAIEVFGDDNELREIEASENLHRRDLGPIERAMHVRALADVHEARFGEGFDGLSPQQIGMVKRWAAKRDQVQPHDDEKARLEADAIAAIAAATYGPEIVSGPSAQHSPEAISGLSGDHSPDTVSGLSSWQEDVADAIGLTSRSLRSYLLIHRRIVAPYPDLGKGFALTALGQQRAAVMDVAKIAGEAARAKVMRAIIDDASITTVAEARVRIGLDDAETTDPIKQIHSRIRASFNRLGLADKRAFLPTLVDLLPPSLKAELRTLLDAEGGDAE